MEKPASMSLREWLVKKTSQSLMVPERSVNTIITHQFDGAYDALDNNNSVEIYEFGKFIFNKKKALHQMKKYEGQMEMYTKKLNGTISEEEKRNLELRMETTRNNIKALSKKLDNGED